MRLAFPVLVVVSVVHPGAAVGQDLMTAPIGFRSGLTEGAVTTRPGTLTIDAGATARWAGGTMTFRVGELNIRVPFNHRLEGRLYANSYSWREDRAGLAGGREDLSVAAAAMLVSHRGIRPVTALIVRLDTPTGTLPRRERSWRPSARWSLGWQLPGRIALHANLGIARDTRAGLGYIRELASVWVSRRLAGRLGACAEVLGSTRERPRGPVTGYLHGGFTYQLRSWMHLDLHAGIGSVAAGAPRWIGLGMRQRA